MQLSDIESAIKLPNAEGWNQTEKDGKLLIENPENVCMVAECSNKVIGTITAIQLINYSRTYVFLIFHCVGDIFSSEENHLEIWATSSKPI